MDVAAAGVAGMPISEEHGGSGGSTVDCCLVSEALGEGGQDGGLGLSLGAHWVIGTVPTWLHGSPVLRQRWLPGLCDGSLMGAWAYTEPEAGSDAAAIRTTAGAGRRRLPPRRHEDLHHERVHRRRLHGAGEDGQGPDRLRRGHHAPGFGGPGLDELGCRSSPTTEVHLQDCRGPAASILGVEREALWRVAFECFDWVRTVMLARIVGAMRATIDQTIRYAKDRRQFGKPVAHFQAVAHEIADMEINYQVCRNAVYKAAWLEQEGREHAVEASVAKALCGKLAVENALESIQIHGGHGHLRFPAGRALRDAKLASIGGGTAEIQKMITSRLLLA